MAHVRIAAAVFVIAAAAATRPAIAQVTVGVESHRDRIDYHFDNPSSFDTPAPVPHDFEQRYVADNFWVTLTVRYTVGVEWETSIGMTPSRTEPADDYDTFHDPDGVVWVAGTSGDARMHGFRLEQRTGAGRIGRVTLHGGYRVRWDGAEFLLGHKTVTRDGTLVQALDVGTRETTGGQLHQIFVGGSIGGDIGRGWQLALDGDAAPTTVGRLVVELPDKYPGQHFAFTAAAFGAAGRLTVRRAPGRWPIEVGVGGMRTWSYRSTASVSRRAVDVRLAVALWR